MSLKRLVSEFLLMLGPIWSVQRGLWGTVSIVQVGCGLECVRCSLLPAGVRRVQILAFESHGSLAKSLVLWSTTQPNWRVANAHFIDHAVFSACQRDCTPAASHSQVKPCWLQHCSLVHFQFTVAWNGVIILFNSEVGFKSAFSLMFYPWIEQCSSIQPCTLWWGLDVTRFISLWDF